METKKGWGWAGEGSVLVRLLLSEQKIPGRGIRRIPLDGGAIVRSDLPVPCLPIPCLPVPCLTNTGWARFFLLLLIFMGEG